MAYTLGIDVGTTYTGAAIARDGRAEIFALGHDRPTAPTLVVLRADGEVLVGDAAERRAAAEPDRVAREFKRRVGDPTPIIVGGTPYGVEALYGHVLRWVRDQATRTLGEAPAMATLTHPASWGTFKRDVLVQAAHQAELGEVGLVTEPEAAAVRYADEGRLQTGQVVAVYDLGGGTFDAALVRATASGFELVGTPEGIEHLGGLDIDQAVLAHVDAAVDGMVTTADATDPAVRSGLVQLRTDCRLAKEALSDDTDTLVPVHLPEVQTEVRLTRVELEAMIRPRLLETVDALRRSVASASLQLDDLASILLVGGSSRIPLVAQVLREETGRPVTLDSHPKFAIALGAAAHPWRAGSTAPGGLSSSTSTIAATGLAAAAATSSPPPATTPGPASPPSSERPGARPEPTPSAAAPSPSTSAADQPAAAPPPDSTPPPAPAPATSGPGGDRRGRTVALVAAAVVLLAAMVGIGVVLVGGGDESAGPTTSTTTPTEDSTVTTTSTTTASTTAPSSSPWTSVTSFDGVLTVEVPTTWDDVDTSPFIVISEPTAHVSAAENLVAYLNTYLQPGVTVALVSTSEVPSAEALAQAVGDGFGYGTVCGGGAPTPYDDGRVVGTQVDWTGCDGTGTTIRIVTGTVDGDPRWLLLAGLQATSDGDLAVLDHVLATIQLAS